MVTSGVAVVLCALCDLRISGTSKRGDPLLAFAATRVSTLSPPEEYSGKSVAVVRCAHGMGTWCVVHDPSNIYAHVPVGLLADLRPSMNALSLSEREDRGSIFSHSERELLVPPRNCSNAMVFMSPELAVRDDASKMEPVVARVVVCLAHPVAGLCFRGVWLLGRGLEAKGERQGP